MRKVISMLLVVLLLGAVAIPAFAAIGCTCAYTPIIYVHGQQAIYKFNEDGTKTEFGSDDDEQVSAAIKEMIPIFAKTLVSQDWDAYADAFYDKFAPLFDSITYDEDGNVPANTGIEWSWTPQSIPASHSYHNCLYTYEYDYRLAPLDVADDLHAYIEAVKAKTGHDHIILASRCGGTNLVAAYIYKYEMQKQYADLDKVLFICGNLLGSDMAEAVMSGNIKINEEAAYRWVKNYDLTEYVGEQFGEYIYTTLDMLENVYGTAMVYKVVDDLYGKLKDNLLARFLKKYHGINAGLVTFVYEHYEEYKNYVFQEPGDLEKYKKLIDKFDDYHYNVQVKNNEILQDMADHGVEVDTVAYYGDQTYPLMESASLTSDRIASVEDQGYGTVVSSLVGTLSDKYIAERKALGFEKYISPDKQVDASTGLFPETTWYLKNGQHHFAAYGGVFDRMVCDLCRQKNITVNTDSRYPQFLNFDEKNEAIIPAQEINGNDVDWASYDDDAQNGLENFITMMRNLIQMIIEKGKDIIQGIIHIFKK